LRRPAPVDADHRHLRHEREVPGLRDLPGLVGHPRRDGPGARGAARLLPLQALALMPRRVWGAGDAPDPWALTYRRTTKEKLLVARPPAIVAEIVPVSRFPILPAGATSAHTALTPTWLPRGWSVSPPTLAVQVMRTERAFVETGALIENAFPAWMPARATGAPRVTVGEGGGADVVVVVVVVPVA